MPSAYPVFVPLKITSPDPRTAPKKERESVPPEEIRKQYFAAYAELQKAETRMKKLLRKGGYICG